MASKLLNLFALSSLAVLVCSFGPSPVAALAAGHDGALRRHTQHDMIAKNKKRDNSKRCKTRSTTLASSTAAPSTTTKAKLEAAESTPAVTSTSSTKAKASSTKSSSSAAKTTAASTNNSNPSGSSKVGLAWPNGGDSSLAKYKTDSTNYLYTWSPDCPSNGSKLGFSCIPMLWGDNQVNDFQKVSANGIEYVLGFNEPNESGQSNMSPQHAADLWKQYLEPLADQGVKLISPATSSAPAGKTWMKDFFAACDGCRISAVAIHWYDVDPQAFITYINDFHDTFGKPIWVTEWACQNFNGGAQCSNDEVWNMMTTVTKYMQSQDWVQQYFAFGIMHDMQGVNTLNQLMASSGVPTDLGYYYINGSN